jgi:hypothetical protein
VPGRSQGRDSQDELTGRQQALQALEMLALDVLSSAVIVAAKSSREG